MVWSKSCYERKRMIFKRKECDTSARKAAPFKSRCSQVGTVQRCWDITKYRQMSVTYRSEPATALLMTAPTNAVRDKQRSFFGSARLEVKHLIASSSVLYVFERFCELNCFTDVKKKEVTAQSFSILKPALPIYTFRFLTTISCAQAIYFFHITAYIALINSDS